MKDKLFQRIDALFYYFYRIVMRVVYQYKTFLMCRGVKDISPEYKKAIRAYWKKYYRRISIRDFKWYNTKTNQKNVRFIPDVVFHSRIEPYFNDLKSMEAFSNKCYYNLFFHGYQVPYTIAKNINGVYLDDSFRILSMEEVLNLCQREEEVVIKPAIQSGGGRNITFIKMDQNLGSKLEAVFKEYQKDFVIQRVVAQHEELADMNPTSLNTVRIHSFLYKGNVHILSFLLRVGMNGSRVDNVSNGGLGVSVNEDGTLNPFSIDKNGNKVYCHPNGYLFKDRKMPSYNKIIQCIQELHPRFARYGFIGWDIAVDQSGEPVIIEFNLMDTNVSAPQLINGPLFKDLTDEVLDEVFRKKRNKRENK